MFVVRYMWKILLYYNTIFFWIICGFKTLALYLSTQEIFRSADIKYIYIYIVVFEEVILRHLVLSQKRYNVPFIINIYERWKRPAPVRLEE